jgi:DNA-binding HxlR family transcriptional regulator
MPTTRSYGDACGIARALDVVGERWALLVVRELLLGPQRFTELRRALRGASSNLVADRLRELDARGVIRKRRLAPPAGSWVYELTEWGRELEPIVLALGGWGLRAPLPPEPTVLTATSVLLYLRDSVRAGGPLTAGVQLDDRMWTVCATRGRLRVQPGEPAAPDVVVRTDPKTLNTLLDNPAMLDAAIAGGRLAGEGDRSALHRLLGVDHTDTPEGGSA